MSCIGALEVPLGTICDAVRGVTFSSGEASYNEFDSSVACLTTSAVQTTVDWKTRRFIPRSRLSRSDSQLLEQGDILVSTANSKELVGKSCFIEDVPFPCTFGAFVTVLRPRAEVLPFYLAAYLNTPAFKKLAFLSSANTTNISNLKVTDILAAKIPLPPLAEQRRIAARLREQLAAVSQARTALEAQLAAAATLPAANLRAVFLSPEAQRWPRRTFGEVCDLLPAKSISMDGDADVRAITSACLTETGFALAGVKSAKMHSRDVAECTVRGGEILVARSNTPELVGRVAMFLDEAPDLVASDLTIRIAPRATMDGAFLTRHLSHLYLGGYWRDRASGASGTMKKITRGQLVSEQIPTPPLAEQRAIAAQLDAELSAALAVHAALEAKLAAVKKLPAALLRAAFEPNG